MSLKITVLLYRMSSTPWYLDRESLNKYQNQYYHEKVKNNTKYYCNICQINCLNKTNHTNHLKTKKHQKKEKEYEKFNEVKQIDSPYKNQILDMINAKYLPINIIDGEPNQSTCRPTQ